MRRVATLVVVLAVLGLAAWLVWPSGPGVRAQEQVIPVMDGPDDDQRVELDTTFFPPAGGGKAPAVLLAHGFGAAKESVRDQAERLAEEGYAVLTWSARGFGRSTGQIALNSPDYEVKDVKQLIDWLAKRPEVLLDAGGDPRVGIVGASYGGAIALMTAAHDRRVDTIVPQVTWHDLADALFPNAGGDGEGVFKRAWAGYFFGRGGVTQQGLRALVEPQRPLSAEEARCGRFLPEICEVYQAIAATGRPTTDAVELLRRSSPVSVQGKITAPTLLIQGQRDSLFTLAQADANARAVAGPVKVVWFDGGHDGGNGEADYLTDLTLGWLADWLKDKPQVAGGRHDEGFTITRDGGRDPGTRQRIRLHPETAAYPGLAGTTLTQVPLTGGVQNVVNPPGGSPASISTLPGTGGLLGGAGGQSALGGLSLDMPGQSASFESAPLAKPLQLTGSPSVSVRVTGQPGEVTLFAKLYDVSDSIQPPTLPASLVSPVKLIIPDDQPAAQATITLPAVDHLFPAGHRLRLTLTTTDMGFATPADPASYQVELAGATVSVPSVAGLAEPPPGLPWWVWAMPLAAVALAGALLATGRVRRGRVEEIDPDAPPLQISGLTKAYRNGEKAVDGLSFRVERGQVLGLLGPNGAGKTTTMRMMMGLIHPDDGEIRIYGQRVTPGAPVLSRLGSFVEGPGFLPHLSGRDNLELYWAATGRPPEEAHFAEALEIAGLGKAVERATRTYSQGMRQRLAIAQAMLGLPDLLVLDEPTNGLDPPQIREMREVLKRYAADGRTVIVSSHLLAEVEQTCSHVVVMHRGRLVSEGPVAKLLAHSTASTNGHGPRLEDVFLDLIGEK
ncbi:alpha/beta fold hydrolase [Nonomuraea sp. NPDC050310]|uniref:alpha/beta fold hydrolase n=1 Tax=unclassified Nonomuraea TaxID=2593643 RepID=UPI00340B6642